jgi:hypothetical protein
MGETSKGQPIGPMNRIILKTASSSEMRVGLYRFHKYCGRLIGRERMQRSPRASPFVFFAFSGGYSFGLWRGFGEGAGLKNPVTEPTRPVRRGQKDRCFNSFSRMADSIFENALNKNYQTNPIWRLQPLYNHNGL